MKQRLFYPLVLLTATICACTGQNEAAAMAGGYIFQPANIRSTPDSQVRSYHWDAPKGLEGDHLIIVDTQLQLATYYIGGHKVGYSAISSGKAGHGTPSGNFTVLAKDANHKSSTYGSVVDSAGNTIIADYTAGEPMPAGGRYKGADMNNALQLTKTGIWMHEGVVTSAPESHGCIRLPKEAAKIFFDNTPVGTPVIIK